MPSHVLYSIYVLWNSLRPCHPSTLSALCLLILPHFCISSCHPSTLSVICFLFAHSASLLDLIEHALLFATPFSYLDYLLLEFGIIESCNHINL